MSVGQIIGMTTLPFISTPFGRKVAMYWYWFILAISITLESVGKSWPVWLIAKLLAGVGVGCLQTTIPTYITEVAPTRIRGGLLMSYSLWFSLGQFFAAVALQDLNQNNPLNYLTAIFTQWGQIGLMLAIYLVLPESPAWCITRGKTERARKSLLRLNKGVKDYNVDEQIHLLTIAVQHEADFAASQRSEKWYAIFKGIDGFRTLVALWTLMSQQFTGLKLFSTFSTYFFQQAGLEDPFLVTCITSAIGIVTNILLISSVDKLGRRNMACAGCTIVWASCMCVGILGVAPQVNATNYLFIFFACCWSACPPRPFFPTFPLSLPSFSHSETNSSQASACKAQAQQAGVSSARSPPSVSAPTRPASRPPRPASRASSWTCSRRTWSTRTSGTGGSRRAGSTLAWGCRL